MKHKTSELSGALLDAAVALAEGERPEIVPYRVSGGMGITFVRDEPVCQVGVEHFEPSSRWEHGGPIIERELIQLENARDSDAPAAERKHFWMAAIYSPFWAPLRPDAHGDGPTPLIAAMRAFVASKLGEEVELP